MKYFLSIKDTFDIINQLNLQFVPILYEGLFSEKFQVPEKSAFGPQIEGYVVRTIDAFPVSKSHEHIAKWVRQGHVQTTKHWSKCWTPNYLQKT